MRKKERKTVITFATTTAAIHMEQCCKKEELPGRLIPVKPVINSLHLKCFPTYSDSWKSEVGII